MKHETFFRKHPVFTISEFAEHQASLGKTGERVQEPLLAYHQKAGRLVRVRGGLYAVIPVGTDPDSSPIDPFLIAAKMAPDAVLSHHTALEFHGRAYSVTETYTYSATRPPRRMTFRSHVFRGARFPVALVRAGKEDFGVSVAERSGIDLRVTSLERTLVDVMDRPDLSGSWEEIWRSLESVEFFDLEVVVAYATLLGNATTAAKVGFFLDQHRQSLMVSDRYLTALRKLRPRRPHYLERARRRSGRLLPEWNLVVPNELLERSWEEVP